MYRRQGLRKMGESNEREDMGKVEKRERMRERKGFRRGRENEAKMNEIY